MVENIKLTALELKRYLKVSIYLPKDYNQTDRDYNVIYMLDGQLFFKALGNEEMVYDISSILDEENAKVVIIGIHSPTNNDWRISEVCPYFKLDGSIIDPSLSYNFLNFIINTLHPLMMGRYRITENAYIMGYKESAILPLYAIYHNPFFNGAGIFCPKLSICENYINDLDSSFDPDKKLFLACGINKGENDKLNELVNKVNSLGISDIEYEYSEIDDDFNVIKEQIINFYNFISKR